MLINHVITLKLTQLIQPRYVNVTDKWTDRWTDRMTCSTTARCSSATTASCTVADLWNEETVQKSTNLSWMIDDCQCVSLLSLFHCWFPFLHLMLTLNLEICNCKNIIRYCVHYKVNLRIQAGSSILAGFCGLHTNNYNTSVTSHHRQLDIMFSTASSACSIPHLNW